MEECAEVVIAFPARRRVKLCGKSSTGWALNETLDEAADAIENMSEAYEKLSRHMDDLAALMPRWIPVTERLPEEDGCYLVAVKNDHKRRYSKTAWFSNGAWFARQDVTHWMPIPKEPKEE